jgi:DNA-binding cell septation regulator SpoVG
MLDLQIQFIEGGRTPPVLCFFVLVYNKLAVHDCKLIQPRNGRRLIAFPNRKVMSHCIRCHYKNSLDADYCSKCGKKLVPEQAQHIDIIHPIDDQTRSEIEKFIWNAWDDYQHQAAQYEGEQK